MSSLKLKLVFGVFVFLLFCTGLCAFKYKSDIDAKRCYYQGVLYYNKGNYSDAYYNFKQINRLSSFYTASVLKQYFCAIKLNDKKTAYIKLVDLLRFARNKNIRPFVIYNEANLALELGLNNESQSLKKFNSIIEKYPDSDFSYAASYKAAKLSADKSFAKDMYIRYLKYAPVGKYSLSILDNLKLSQSILNNDDKEIIAESYYLNYKYEDALKYYNDTSFTKNWYKISKCYRALNRREEEKAALLSGLNIEQSEVEEKDIDAALNRFIALSGVNKIQMLQDFYTKYQYSYIYPTVLYNLAESTKAIRSIELYELIVKNYPDSDWASNSLWEIFWYNYSQGHYKKCIHLGQTHGKKYPKAADAPRVAYWTARAMLKEKQNQSARELLYKVIKDYPLSYYAFLSARQLRISKAQKIITKKPLPKSDISSLDKFLFKDDKTLLFLAKNNDYEIIDELKISDEYIKARIMYEKQNYQNSINTAKNEYLKKIEENEEFSASYSDEELKLIYPILYEDEINNYSAEYNQSPYLFISIIREESHFNKNAVSSAGAVGLVQLMPATAYFIENGNITSESLKQENIRIGLKYFSYLVDLFDKNPYLAILSYNAGPGNIKKWRSDSFIKSDEIDEFVENIPYLETKNYIKKVLSTYWIYFNVYKKGLG